MGCHGKHWTPRPRDDGGEWSYPSVTYAAGAEVSTPTCAATAASVGIPPVNDPFHLKPLRSHHEKHAPIRDAKPMHGRANSLQLQHVAVTLCGEAPERVPHAVAYISGEPGKFACCAW